jgi:hypothetical protein
MLFYFSLSHFSVKKKVLKKVEKIIIKQFDSSLHVNLRQSVFIIYILIDFTSHIRMEIVYSRKCMKKNLKVILTNTFTKLNIASQPTPRTICVLVLKVNRSLFFRELIFVEGNDGNVN